MIFRKVNPDEVGKLAEMYDEVLDRQPFDEYGPKWTKGIYPCQQDYTSHCNRGEFHAGEDNGVFGCRAVLCFGEDPMYKAGNWHKRVSDDEVAVIHLLAVAPSYRGKGTAMSFLKYLTEQAGKKARVIHLDVLDGNLAAGRLYLKRGFTYSGDMESYYEDIGKCLINLYEYDLEKQKS
jgi:GNAT superfamily N-acetyltransferase